MFKVNNKNTRTAWRRSGVSIVNFEHISLLFSSVSIDDFQQVNVSWVFPFYFLIKIKNENRTSGL